MCLLFTPSPVFQYKSEILYIHTEERGYKDVVKPVFISVDPARDSVGQLRYYGQDFHPSIDYLTGTPEQVAAVAKAYRVYFSKVPN